jgi:hypothetical protein
MNTDAISLLRASEMPDIAGINTNITSLGVQFASSATNMDQTPKGVMQI